MSRRALLLLALTTREGRARKEPEALALETRRRAYRAVVENPGAHLSEVGRLTGLETNHARYHLDALERAGLVSVQHDAGFTRYFPRATDGLARDLVGARDKRTLAELRKSVPLRVAVVLLVADGPLALRDLAERLSLAPSTLSYHLDRLVSEGIVERLGATAAARQYKLADPDGVQRLLVKYPPRRDLVASFIELWDGLALPPPRMDDGSA